MNNKNLHCECLKSLRSAGHSDEFVKQACSYISKKCEDENL